MRIWGRRSATSVQIPGKWVSFGSLRAAMEPTQHGQITRLLHDISAGRSQAMDELLPLVYAELRRMAGARMSSERGSHTLQPTALVHEAFLRLTGGKTMDFENRAHFFGAAAEAMRRILVESARRRSSLKRGGDQIRLELTQIDLTASQSDPEQLLALDELISKLERHDRSIGTVVKLRHFVGMTVQEVADAMGSSPRTVHRQWNTGRAWLKQELLAAPE